MGIIKIKRNYGDGSIANKTKEVLRRTDDLMRIVIAEEDPDVEEMQKMNLYLSPVLEEASDLALMRAETFDNMVKDLAVIENRLDRIERMLEVLLKRDEEL